MSRVCFVSYEIHPTTWGGCGVLLHNAARVLLAEGHEVLFLLDVPEQAFDRFQNVDRLALPNHQRCRAYHVDALCREIAFRPQDFLAVDAWRAYRFHFACRQVYAAERPDVIATNMERVLTARLRDARFFFDADREKPLAAYLDRLSTVLFHKKLGSYQ